MRVRNTNEPTAVDPALSRPIATAQRLGDDAPDRHRFTEKRVLLTGDPEALATPNGRVILLNALRLLVRICPNVVVRLPEVADALGNEVRAEAIRVAFGATVAFETAASSNIHTESFDAVLSVGGRASGAGWTTVSSDGWNVRIDATGAAPAGTMERENAVGAIAAASLGVAEVFKRLVGLKPGRGLPADGTPFSMYTYTSGSEDPGPALPDNLEIDAVLVGFGAIGNGIGAVFRELPLSGRLTVIDRQKFGRENLGTCVLIGPRDVGREKVDVASELVTSRGALRVLPLGGDVEALVSTLSPVPPMVLNALDNRDARRAVQTLWADITIDGAIGDFMTQVARHPGDPAIDIACLRCLNAPDSGPPADVLAARASGLTLERVRDADDVVREEDVKRAPLDKRDLLRANLGAKICAVTGAAVLAAISDADHAEGFEPSVPFVATMSAAMVVGEAVKTLCGLASPLEPRFQFSVLTGPALGLDFPEARHADCQCTLRRSLIAQFRRDRAGISRS